MVSLHSYRNMKLYDNEQNRNILNFTRQWKSMERIIHLLFRASNVFLLISNPSISFFNFLFQFPFSISFRFYFFQTYFLNLYIKVGSRVMFNIVVFSVILFDYCNLFVVFLVNYIYIKKTKHKDKPFLNNSHCSKNMSFRQYAFYVQTFIPEQQMYYARN